MQTQSAHPFPSLFCLFPPPCKTGISKELWCQDRAPPWEVLWQVSTVCTSKQKVGVTQGTFLTTITQKTLKLCKHEELLTAHTHTQRYTVKFPQCYSLYVKGIFSVWRTDKPDNNEQDCQVNSWRSRRRRKRGPGECPNRGPLSSPLTFKRAGNETAVSKMTCNIPCQGIHQ